MNILARFALLMIFSTPLLAQPAAPTGASDDASAARSQTDVGDHSERAQHTISKNRYQHMPLIMQQMMRMHHQQTRRDNQALDAGRPATGKF